MIIKNKLSSAISLALMGVILTGCGGSGGETTKVEPINQAPTITLENKTINEKETFSITATVSDSDGTISSYQWKELSQLNLELSGNNTNTLTFTAPELMADAQAELELTVTDNDGAIASKKVTVDVKQLTIATTLQGYVSHQALFGGEITVSASGVDSNFTTTIDNTGYYQALITLDDSLEDSFINVVAKGTGNNAIAAYKSVLGSMALLREKAGNDELLTSDEFFAVNVSNITTANYGLLKVASENNDILTDAEFTQRKLQVSNESVLTLATAIDVAINAKTGQQVQKTSIIKVSRSTSSSNSKITGDTDLPADVSDTLELVSDIEQAKVYVSDVQDSDEYSQTQQNILSSDKLKDSSTYNTPDNYHLLPTNPLTQSLGSIQFNDDSTGTWFNTLTKTIKQAQSAFTWTETEGVITVNLNSPETVASKVTVEIGGVKKLVNLETTVLTYEIKRYSSHGTYDDLVITQNILKHYPNGEFSDENSSESQIHTALKSTKQLPSNQNTLSAVYLTLPYEQTSGQYNELTVHVFADKFTFNADGTGSTKVLPKDFTWQKEANELTISFGDNSKIIIVQVNTKNDVASHLMVKHIDASGNIISKTVGEGNIVSETATWTNDNIVGIYKYDNAIFDSPLDQFWIELNADNTALTVGISDKDGNGTITTDEIITATGDWKINSDGTLAITRYKDKQTNGFSPDCNADNTECFLFNTRTWNLISTSNDQYLLFQHHDWDDLYPNSEVYQFDLQQWDIRTIHKIAERPVTID
ncbi:MAG: hypothetical protein JKY81_07265 [Colwellia sp.]|nr:hypothetical protein [Colwellia sp.]